MKSGLLKFEKILFFFFDKFELNLLIIFVLHFIFFSISFIFFIEFL